MSTMRGRSQSARSITHSGSPPGWDSPSSALGSNWNEFRLPFLRKVNIAPASLLPGMVAMVIPEASAPGTQGQNRSGGFIWPVKQVHFKPMCTKQESPAPQLSAVAKIPLCQACHLKGGTLSESQI